MLTRAAIETQINQIVAYLVEIGLAGDQNFAFRRELAGGVTEISFQQAAYISIALKDRAYAEIYENLTGARAYNAKMPDGALIQLMYRFSKEELQSHRLSFFPAPNLEEFQNNPEVYLGDEMYADVVARNIVPFPIRFDYVSNTSRADHPKSHLTLGQYENCRIPVTAPLTPFWFTDFILRNFYHTAFLNYAGRLPRFSDVFADCIVANEKSVVHLQVPTAGTLRRLSQALFSRP